MYKYNWDTFISNAAPSFFDTVLDLYTEGNSLFSISNTEVFEGTDTVTYEVDMPGVLKESLTVEAEKGVLTIVGHRKKPEKDPIYKSKKYGEIKYKIGLPSGLDVDAVKAELKDGVLKIKIPKVINKKSVTIL